jgi:hypothetical protein
MNFCKNCQDGVRDFISAEMKSFPEIGSILTLTVYIYATCIKIAMTKQVLKGTLRRKIRLDSYQVIFFPFFI